MFIRPEKALIWWRQGGLSLIELVMFIVVVSVGVAGILSVMHMTTRNSVDPMIRKQALAIAQSLLEEITLQPFTLCDPSHLDTATGACAVPQGFAPTDGETRGGTGPTGEPFDNVGDYNDFTMNPIADITGDAIPGLRDYTANVNVRNPAAPVAGVATAEIAEITVRVVGPGGTDVTLTGYRFRYAP